MPITETKTWGEMAARERDALVAEKVMGWTVDQRNETTAYAGYRPDGSYMGVPWFTADHNAVRQVEDEIERRGLWAEYVQCLAYGIDAPPIATMSPDMYPSYRVWSLLRATPDQRCRAAVEVLG